MPGSLRAVLPNLCQKPWATDIHFRRRSFLEVWPAAMLLGVAYACLVYLALEFRYESVAVAIIWPANGVAIGALCFVPHRHWIRHALCLSAAIFLGNAAQGVPATAALGFVAANLIEIFVGLELVRRLRLVALRRVRPLTHMLALTCFAAPAIGAIVGAAVASMVLGVSASSTWQTWFVADALGNLVFIPLALAIGGHTLSPPINPLITSVPPSREGFLLTASFLVAAIWVFSTNSPHVNGGFRTEVMLAPWLVWCAIRFPIGSTSALNLCLVLIVLGSCLSNTGPFASPGAPPPNAVFNAQVFVGTLSAMSLIVGSAAQEKRVSSVLLEKRITRAYELEKLAAARGQELWYAAARLKEAQEESEHASQAKSEFLARMSHEIRTPLTAILGFAEILAERVDVAEDADDLATIQRSGQHLLAVINEILDHAKIESGRMEVELQCVELRSLVNEVADLLGLKAAEKGLELNLVVADALPHMAITDPTRLRQLLFNLMGNAIKFTESGGVALDVDFALKGDAPYVLFEVRDTGIGMNAEELARIFEPYAQANAATTRRHGGTGLGLSISRHIARLLGGELTVESSPGQGSTFRVELPYDEAVAAPSASRYAAGDSLPPCDDSNGIATLLGIRVLVADDGLDNRRFLSRVLEGDHAEVVCAEDGAAAVAACLAGKATCPFHVILMDAQMPIMDGLEAVRRLRAAGVQVPIAALTADASVKARELAIAAGCDVYLTKPIAKQLLLDAVRRLAAQAEHANAMQC